MIWRYLLAFVLFVSFLWGEIDAAAGHMVEALPPRDIGKEVYQKHCVACHGVGGRGVANIRFGSQLLQQYEIKDLIGKLQNGCKGNPDSPYSSLKVYELVKVVRYIIKDEFR